MMARLLEIWYCVCLPFHPCSGGEVKIHGITHIYFCDRVGDHAQEDRSGPSSEGVE
jgi:hypothetical protein